MIINKIRLTEFIFLMILVFILNNCHVRQNSVVKVDDYYSDENSYVESEEENQQYEQKIFNKVLKSLLNIFCSYC